jgi:5-methylcytosine-specific restriction endonuclease McrA
MNKKTLVLNSSYQPIRIAPAKDAFVMVWGERASTVVNYPKNEAVLRTVDKIWDVPSVIRIHRFIHQDYPKVTLTKRNIFLRDSYTCAYTGEHLTNYNDLSIDHIIPRSKGGKHTWDNVVTSKQKVNEEKGDYLLGVDPEVDHLPIPKVGRPHYLLILQNGVRNMPEEWKPYLYL